MSTCSRCRRTAVVTGVDKATGTITFRAEDAVFFEQGLTIVARPRDRWWRRLVAAWRAAVDAWRDE